VEIPPQKDMQAYSDLRAFLKKLNEEKQLLTIREEVLPEPDLAAAGRAVTLITEQAPALLFNNLKGYRNAQIVLNVHGSWANHALCLGMPKKTPIKQQFFEFVRRYQQYPGKTEHRTEAPWQEVIVEKEINLFDLIPLFRLNQGDGGFYIDKACIVTRDPDDWENDDKQNVGIYRLQVKGKSRLGIQPVPVHDAAIHLAHAESRGEDLPVAIAIGNEPIISLVAGMPLLYEQSEYAMAGAMQQSPYPIVQSRLTGLDIPWGSEYVLEGRILSRQREAEGPFGEFTGHYSGCRKTPIIEVDRVSHRRNPIFEHLYIGTPWTEIDYMLALNTCAPLYVQLKRDFPEVVAVNATYTHGLVIIVSTKRRFGGFAKNVGLRVMTTPHGMGYAKVVIVVDENVDPFNLSEVMWAISTKMNPAGDLVVVPHVSVVPLDPSSEPAGMTHKVIIDATTPVAADKRGRIAQALDRPIGTEKWEEKLKDLLRCEGNEYE
jgi:UbiD family decarboxylase